MQRVIEALERIQLHEPTLSVEFCEKGVHLQLDCEDETGAFRRTVHFPQGFVDAEEAVLHMVAEMEAALTVAR